MLVRLQTAVVKGSYSEVGGRVVSATFHPIEFKYPGQPLGGGSGGGYPGPNPFDVKPVETEIGKSLHVGILSGNSIAPQPQQSIANLLEACAGEKDPMYLKLDLVLSIPATEVVSGFKEERDYSHWFIESIET